MLNPQALSNGKEQYEFFEVEHLARRGKNATRIQYDYRAENGNLFSCVAKSLEDARAKRDQWIIKNTPISL